MTKKAFEVSSLKVDNVEGQVLGGGTTAERNSSPENKTVRVNTDTLNLEVYFNGAWFGVGDKETKIKGVVAGNQPTELASLYPVNTTAGAFSLPFPAGPSVGSIFSGFDQAGTWDSNPLTLVPNGDNVEGASANVERNVKGGYFRYIYTGPSVGWIDTAKIPEAVGAITAWVAVTTATTVNALPNTGYVVYTQDIGAAVTINLPSSSPTFGVVRVVDRQGGANTYPITVGRNGKRINDEAENDVIEGDFESREYTYFGVANSKDSWITTSTNQGSGSTSEGYKSLTTENLNALDPGTYTQSTSSNASTARNYPYDNFVGTIVYAGNVQHATTEDNEVFRRTYNGSSWGAWVHRNPELKAYAGVITGDFTLTSLNHIYNIGAITSDITIRLPTTNLKRGDKIGFIDNSGYLSDHSLILNGVSNNVVGSYTTYNFSGAFRSLVLIWNGTKWLIYSDTQSNGKVAAPTEAVITGTSGNSAKVGSIQRVDTTAGPVRINLPTGARTGETIWFVDTRRTFADNYLLVSPSGIDRIAGKGAGFITRQNGHTFALTWSGDPVTGWIFSSNTFDMTGHYGLPTNSNVLSASATIVSNRHYVLNNGGGSITITFPSNPVGGDRVSIGQLDSNVAANTITLAAGTGKTFEGGRSTFAITKPLNSFEFIYYGNVWFTVRDSDAGRATNWYNDVITTFPTTLKPNSGNLVRTSTGSPEVILPPPSAVKQGDVIWVADYSSNASVRAITINRNGSNMNGVAASTAINYNGQVMGFVYAGSSVGWVTINDTHSHLTNNPLNNITETYVTAGSSRRPNFSKNVRVVEYLLQSNLTILKPTLPPAQGGSFKIILKMHTAGGYIVNLPGTGDNWYAGDLTAIDNSPNAVNIISGDFDSDGNVYYNVSNYSS